MYVCLFLFSVIIAGEAHYIYCTVIIIITVSRSISIAIGVRMRDIVHARGDLDIVIMNTVTVHTHV
jgi:hypothetical protein